MTKKKEILDRSFYDKGFADFATRLDNDLKEMDGLVRALFTLDMNLDVLVSDKETISSQLNISMRIIEKLGKRMLESAKRLPFANEYYYARQDPQPGENFGTDDREPFLKSKISKVKK